MMEPTIRSTVMQPVDWFSDRILSSLDEMSERKSLKSGKKKMKKRSRKLSKKFAAKINSRTPKPGSAIVEPPSNQDQHRPKQASEEPIVFQLRIPEYQDVSIILTKRELLQIVAVYLVPTIAFGTVAAFIAAFLIRS